MMHILEVEKINVYYGEFRVLKDVTLNIGDNELVAVFGPNGHGKSTLLKAICGLHPPTSGSIKYNGEEISNMPPEKIVEMGLVYIAEDRHLFPQMTVLENLKLGAFNKKARKKKILDENLEYVFHLFPRLKDWTKRYASTLSGGEARMLAIGRGLMSSAKLLVIDEPSLGLAPIVRTDVFNKIAEINKSGMSVLLVEQNVAEASKLIKRSYALEDGRIVFEGDKKQLLDDEHLKKVFLGV
jgi:branched-chain amino acid transport system ATP-binding protein